MSPRKDPPRDDERRDVWIAGPDDVVYVINEEAVARLRAVMAAAAARPRPRRRGAGVRRHDHLAAIASRS